MRIENEPLIRKMAEAILKHAPNLSDNEAREAAQSTWQAWREFWKQNPVPYKPPAKVDTSPLQR